MMWLTVATLLLQMTQGPAVQSIGAARDLYASARYDEALALLNELRPADAARTDERRTIEQYRSLCLLALGRGDEAQAAIAEVVRMDPFYQPGEAEAAPRVRATFAEVRERLLPDIASSRYEEAKAAYDRKAFAEAASAFRQLVALLDDRQMKGRLPDLRTLAAGFAELATAAAAPPPAPEPKEEPVTEPEPPPAPAPVIHTGETPGIIGPVTLRQDVPAVPFAIKHLVRGEGIVDMVIDEQGRLATITLRTSLHPVYDKLLVDAARNWKYEPATLDGKPVAFRKILQIAVSNR